MMLQKIHLVITKFSPISFLKMANVLTEGPKLDFFFFITYIHSIPNRLPLRILDMIEVRGIVK